MIKELLIENFILIESQKITFTKGLNVLTGETGHGKSILLKAVMLLFQGNISKKFIRNDTQTSKVKGTISIEKKNLIPKDLINKYKIDSEVIIERTFNNKKSSILINNIDVNLNELEELGKYLCQALTQFQKFDLLKPEAQLHFVDSLLPSQSTKQKYLEIFSKYDSQLFEKRKLEKELDQLNFIIDYKKEEYENLSSLDITEDEFDLDEKISKLENFDIEREKINHLLDIFNNDENGLYTSFTTFKKAVHKSSLSEKFQELLEELSDRLTSTENLIIQEINSLENSHESLEEIISRYNQLKPYIKKHNNSIEKLYNHITDLKATITRHSDLQEKIEEIKLTLHNYETSLKETGKELTKERTKISQVIEKKVLSEFKELNLGDSELKIRISSGDINPQGLDIVEFLIKTNKGGQFYPLEEVVSGGELSRIMFTLINIQKNNGQILCFDEIDAGIGGKTSIQLSKKLDEIRNDHQIICITHSPSIAVIANNHIFVSKSHKENSTITNFDSLNNDLILTEIARMLGYDSNKDGISLTQNIIKELIHQIKR